jgi:hypothetical protein
MMLQENGEAESSAAKAFTCVLTYFDSQSHPGPSSLQCKWKSFYLPPGAAAS